nr:uncharacterized protein LOC106681680 [Halyomorpha halys]
MLIFPMFSTKERLKSRTGKNSVERYDFLKLLVDEFYKTKSRDAQEQVIANLANFAYDPINYEFIRKLHIIDVFLDEIGNNNEKIAEFAIGGLCNVCLDPINKEYIINKRGVSIVANCLFHKNEEIIISAITTLTFLITPASKSEITCPEIVECITTHLRNPSTRIKNLANVYLETYCSKKQVAEAARNVDLKLGKLEENKEVMPHCRLSSKRGNELGVIKNQKEVIEREITEEDVTLFSKVTGDFNVIHSNNNEKPGIVHGALLNGIVSGVIGTKLPGNGTVVLSQTLNFPNPCFVGDTVIFLANLRSKQLQRIPTQDRMVIFKFLLFLGCICLISCEELKDIAASPEIKNTTELTPCICGVFLSGQFKRGSPPNGPPVLLHEYDENFVCSPLGNKQCTNKCLDVLVKHLSNSPTIICGSIDRDCFRERAYLFIKNCNNKWTNTNLSAGREYCCKDGTPYKCPYLS